MEAHEYRTMFEFEASYWWYRALHAILLDTLKSLGVGKDAQVLDAGCGTGQNLVNIAQAITPRVAGFDFSPFAVPFWKRRGLKTVCLASVNEIPYPDNAFEAVMSIDVLECTAVHEEQAYGELWRVTKADGLILLVVPAYKWLLTKEHHEAVGASRRYLKHEAVALMSSRPVEIVRATHLFALPFPAIAGYRLALRLLPHGSDAKPHSELRPLHPTMNALLASVMNVERRLLSWTDLPLGSSILIVARKSGI